MDPGNPVIGLCSDGMAAEQRGNPAGARAAFTSAWECSTDDYERCVAAHYLARQQDDPAQSLEWNARSLELALNVGDDRIAGFLPSLYLNLGHSYEELGDRTAARTHYENAATSQHALRADGYGNLVRDAIQRGLSRTEGEQR